MTYFYVDLGIAFYWLKICFSQSGAHTTQIWAVTGHQYGISAVVSQTSFRVETADGVARCQLFFRQRKEDNLTRYYSNRFKVICMFPFFSLLILCFRYVYG